MTNRRQDKKRTPRCAVCAIKLMCEYQRQMHAKSGPLYDEWRDSMARRFAVGSRGTPPPGNLPRSAT